jgi:hypothetical protein
MTNRALDRLCGRANTVRSALTQFYSCPRGTRIVGLSAGYERAGSEWSRTGSAIVTTQGAVGGLLPSRGQAPHLSEPRRWAILGEPVQGVAANARLHRHLSRGHGTESLDRVGIYGGTTTGKSFASDNEGTSWYVLAANLPPVYSVSASVL